MHALLADDWLGAWPEDKITILVNPEDSRLLVRQIRQICSETSGALLIYFVGHGTLSSDGQLIMALRDTSSEHPDITGLEYRWIRDALLHSPARMKSIILDCCYSGRAISHLSSEVSQLADLTDVSGTYTLTAADRVAHAGNADRCTGFTEQLVKILEDGIPGGPDVLTFADIFPHLKRSLFAANLPVPNQRGTDTAASYPLAFNSARADGEVRFGRGREVAGQDVESLVSRGIRMPTPQSISGELFPFRGSVADGKREGAQRLWQDFQDAIYRQLEQLHDADRSNDAVRLLAAYCRVRQPDEIGALYRSLLHGGRLLDSQRLVRVAVATLDGAKLFKLYRTGDFGREGGWKGRFIFKKWEAGGDILLESIGLWGLAEQIMRFARAADERGCIRFLWAPKMLEQIELNRRDLSDDERAELKEHLALGRGPFGI
ncbi:hypothetical protein [Kitasatospora sp. NPDC094016]|uniref:caspase, EACC1-associated type n=1 Tax=Kitasatospora sp. NPDC094016 TaxID=3154986 RepID=UPI00332EE419